MLQLKMRQARKIKNVQKCVFASIVLFTVLTACSRTDMPVTAKKTDQSNQVSKVEADSLPWYIRQYGTGNSWQLQTSLHRPEFGMYELTQYPDKQPTQEQQTKADALLANTLSAVKSRGWLNKEQAIKDGYQAMYKDKIHYYNEEYLYDGKLLDPEKPEFLMYYPTERGDMLMGVMFSSAGRGPQIGGPLTLWHYHIEQGICYRNGYLPIGQVDENGQCEEGVRNDHSPEMLHMWFFDHPDGRFATRMRLSEEHFQLAKEQVLKLYNAK